MQGSSDPPEGPGPQDTSDDSRSSGGRMRLLRSAASMSGITMGSRVLGLLREQVRAHYLGTSLASDAFGIAFQIPNLLRRLVAEGAMSAGFIPVLSDEREAGGDEQAFDFARRFLNVSLLALMVITALGVLGAGVIVTVFTALSSREISPEAQELTTSLTRWMFPYIALVAWAAVMQGILNTWRIFWVSAFTSVLLNLAIIGAAVAFATGMEQPAYAFAFGVLVGGALQLFFQVPYVFKLGFRWKPTFRPGPAVKKAMVLLVPTLFGAGVYQINVLVSQAVAWGLGDGAVSSLQYSSRLLELTLGVFAVALSTVVLPSLAADAAAGAVDKVQATVLYALRLTCFVCLPMTAGLMLLGTETASILFERGAYSSQSSAMTGFALTFHMIGLTHIALGRVFVPVFYAFKDTRTPVLVAFASMILNIALCYALAPSLSHGGIALANTGSALLQTILLTKLMERHTGPIEDAISAGSVARSVLATGVMIAVVVGLRSFFGLDARSGAALLLLPYLAIVAAAVATYVSVALLTKHPELSEVLGVVRRRLKR